MTQAKATEAVQRVVLLPAYNEEASIETLLDKFQTLRDAGANYRVIVCNDGSSDRTADLLQKYEQSGLVETIHHSLNRGLGETVRDLFERAVEVAEPTDVVLRMDCDDTHEPAYMESMIAKLDEGYDVVIASRFAPGGGQRGVNAYRTFVSRSANLFMKIFFPLPGVREYSCGYRAYRAAVLQQAIQIYGNNFIQLRGLGFTCTLEKLVKLKLLGARFAEVPFVLRYDQKMSGSKMVSSVTTLGYLVMALLYHWPWGGWRTTMRHKERAARSGDQG